MVWVLVVRVVTVLGTGTIIAGAAVVSWLVVVVEVTGGSLHPASAITAAIMAAARRT